MTELNAAVKARIVLNFLTTAHKRINSMPLKELQRKYTANKGKRIRIIFKDADRAVIIQFTGGEMKLSWLNRDYDVTARLTLDTLLNVADRHIKQLDLRTNCPVLVPYTTLDAFIRGDIDTEGDASTNDIKIAIEALADHIDVLKELLKGVKRNA